MTDSEGTEKQGGLGKDGTIPPALDGVAATLGDEKSNFNPEEDPEAATDPEDTPTPQDSSK